MTESTSARGPELPGSGPLVSQGWRATVRLGPFPPEVAQRVRAALAPESGAAVPGALVAVDAPSPQEVRVRVEAPTTSALRAALNAHLRWVDLALRVERWAGERAAATPAPGLPPSGP